MRAVEESDAVPNGPWKLLSIESGGDRTGAWLYLFDASTRSANDFWFENVQSAKEACSREWGTPLDSWRTTAPRPVSATLMKAPIICNDCPDPTIPGDLAVYHSVEWAERGHEPYDAKDPAFQLYDSEGRLLKMEALWDTYSVRIEPAEAESTHLARLTSIVKQYLSHSDAPAGRADRPLAEMLQYIYERDPNPYSGYRRPGAPRLGFWAGLIDWFRPGKRRDV